LALEGLALVRCVRGVYVAMLCPLPPPQPQAPSGVFCRRRYPEPQALTLGPLAVATVVGMRRRRLSGHDGRPALVCRLSAPGRSSPLLLEDAGDVRAALYRVPSRRDEAECRRQEHKLIAQAVPEDENMELSPSGEAAGRLCRVSVHYSWDCLRRLQSALESGRKITVGSVLVPQGTPDDQFALAAGISPNVYTAGRALMATEFSTPGSRKSFCHFVTAFPVSCPLDEMRPPFVVLHDVESSHTIGQIIRTAYHFGLDSVVVSRATWEHLDARACRVAMGWAYHMDFHVADSVEEVLARLRARGVELYAADPSSPLPITPRRPRVDGGWALVLGGEESGLSPAVAGLCDVRVRVPLREQGLLSVAHAAAICLYELGGLCQSDGEKEPPNQQPPPNGLDSAALSRL